jgi:ubiquitin thioesterase OTU1
MEFLPIRRYVDSDNSCLFSSIAYLNDKEHFNENSSMIYRLMIVDHINDNDISEDILGMPKADYIQNISESSTWGGAIELKLFSEIFKMQIASLDVESKRIDIFGEIENYNKRIYLIYNGYHYDPLVMNYSHESSNDLDITIFNPEDHCKLTMFRDYLESVNE